MSVMFIIFLLLLLIIFGKILKFAIKAAWGILKTLLAVIPLPVVLIVLAMTGHISVSFLILTLVGIFAMLRLN